MSQKWSKGQTVGVIDNPSLEHEPWIGEHYKRGGLMIWGFSHHKKTDEEDLVGFTDRTVRELALSGEHWFFNALRGFFGQSDAETFWNSIAFANTLPNCVCSSDRYGKGTVEARMTVKVRVKRILNNLAPRKAILFSRKGWSLWPELDGSVSEPAQTMMVAPNLFFGTYDIGAEFEVLAYNLPHPQFQQHDQLRERVSYAMNHLAS